MYSIGEAARRLGIAPSTLRYYDKEGLLPFLSRGSGGLRQFREEDLQAVRLIQCLKKTGLSLRDIRAFLELPAGSGSTAEKRLAILTAQRAVLDDRLRELTDMIHLLDYKIDYYRHPDPAKPPFPPPPDK